MDPVPSLLKRQGMTVMVFIQDNIEQLVKPAGCLLNLVLSKLGAIVVLRVFLLHINCLQILQGVNLLAAQTLLHGVWSMQQVSDVLR